MQITDRKRSGAVFDGQFNCLLLWLFGYFAFVLLFRIAIHSHLKECKFKFMLNFIHRTVFFFFNFILFFFRIIPKLCSTWMIFVIFIFFRRFVNYRKKHNLRVLKHIHLAVAIAKMKLKANGKLIELKCFKECHRTSHTTGEERRKEKNIHIISKH